MLLSQDVDYLLPLLFPGLVMYPVDACQISDQEAVLLPVFHPFIFQYCFAQIALTFAKSISSSPYLC